MCGINLILDRTCKLSEDVLMKMSSGTAHRGPHHTGKHIFRNHQYQLFASVNRLRIIDRDESSDQPFMAGDNERMLLFNGEIYNHDILRNNLLGKGVRFNTGSDTETLFHALNQHELKDLGDLNGMFSFVSFDPDKHVLMIARDRWGMKPLYYYQDEHYLIISSEIRGILATGLVRKELNERQIPHYLRYRYVSPGQSLFQNIYPFARGTGYIYHIGDEQWIKQEFMTPSVREPSEPVGDHLVSRVEELLTDSLVRHFPPGRAAGLFLSGGVDSTLLLALARKHQLPLPYLFSIVNTGKEAAFGTDDHDYSRKAAAQYGGQAEILEYDASILEELEPFSREMDHPVGDSAFFLTQILSKRAVESTHVILSGAGADEIFAGYNRHKAFYWYLRNYRKIRSFQPMLRKFFDALPVGSGLPFRKRLQLWRKGVVRLDPDPERTYDHFMALDMPWVPGQGTPLHGGQTDPDIETLLTYALERDRREYLPEDVLTVNDRSAMRHHVEMRMPYLDLELTRFVRRLPSEWLLSKGTKWILKEILRDHGGTRYTNRSKEGFGLPFGAWLRSTKYRYLIGYLEEYAGWLHPHLDRKVLDQILAQHLSGKRDYSQELWSILILVMWMKHQFE